MHLLLNVLISFYFDESEDSLALLNSAGPGGSLSVWCGSDGVSQLQGRSQICSLLFFCLFLTGPLGMRDPGSRPGIEPYSGSAES